MPRETGGGSESGEQRGENGRLDDWARIEAEQAKRDRTARAWDATHDPSEEFEQSARPLGPDYGRDRPRHREIPPEVAAEFGRTPEQLQALREKMFDEMDARAARWAADEQPTPSEGRDTHDTDAASSTRESTETPTWTLDTRLSTETDAPTARDVLNRFAGPDGLTAEQRAADERYIAAHAEDRPWLRVAADHDPLIRHVYVERDRAGGHDPARHDGWRDAADQEQRAAAAKDPAHPTDSPTYHNAVDHLKGTPPPDDIGGRRKQHIPGEHATWIADPTVWAVATARTIEHPTVQRALASDTPPRNVKIPIEDVLGNDGHRQCDGYTLVTDGFASSRDAADNRDAWIARLREVRRDHGVPYDRAEEIVEQESANGDIRWTKPQVKRIETFDGGTCQINIKRSKDGSETRIATICYNPPMDETERPR